MARIDQIPAEDLSTQRITAVRREVGEAEFMRQLNQSAAAVHAQAEAAWKAGDRVRHDRLLNIGWLLARHERRSAQPNPGKERG